MADGVDALSPCRAGRQDPWLGIQLLKPSALENWRGRGVRYFTAYSEWRATLLGFGHGGE